MPVPKLTFGIWNPKTKCTLFDYLKTSKMARDGTTTKHARSLNVCSYTWGPSRVNSIRSVQARTEGPTPQISRQSLTVLGSKEFSFTILSSAIPRQELPRVLPYASISWKEVPKSWPSHCPSCKATVTSHS